MPEIDQTPEKCTGLCRHAQKLLAKQAANLARQSKKPSRPGSWAGTFEIWRYFEVPLCVMG